MPALKKLSFITLVIALFGCTNGSPQAGNSAYDTDWTSVTIQAGSPSIQSNAEALTATYDGQNALELSSPGLEDNYTIPLQPPATLVLHPTRDLAAINHGAGSGQFSSLIILDLDTSGRRLGYVEHDLRRFFIELTGCEIDPRFVLVRGQGWRVDVPEIWVSFEVWNREHPCSHDELYFARYDVFTRNVREVLSRSDTWERFCRDEAFDRRFGPNCRTAPAAPTAMHSSIGRDHATRRSGDRYPLGHNT